MTETQIGNFQNRALKKENKIKPWLQRAGGLKKRRKWEGDIGQRPQSNS